MHEMTFCGQRRLVVEGEDGLENMISVYEDRISSVSRPHKPATALTYRDLLAALTRIYGPWDDLSRFPGYADDWDSRETAIAVGKGRASHRWKQGSFTISLSWGNRKFILLDYMHVELTTKAMKARPSDL